MEEKKAYKISMLTLFLLILSILLICVVIVFGFLMYQQQQKINNMEANLNTNSNEEGVPVTQQENEVQNTVKPEENAISRTSSNSSASNAVSNATNTVEESSSSEFARKIVENREYIYNAGYSPNGIQTNSYTSSDGNTYSVSDIVVPYINMSSKDGSEMNNEIEAIYNKCISEFTVCSQNKNSFIKVNYTSYITSNIYSLLINIQRGQNGETSNEYVAYNFDIMSGANLDYNQVCYIAGIDSASDTIKETINKLEDYEKYYITDTRYNSQEVIDARNTEIQNCKNQVYTSYQENLLNSKLVYFLDNNLKLNIVVNVVLPNNEGSYERIMIVEA